MCSVGVAIPSLFSRPRGREFLPFQFQRKKAFTRDSLKKVFIKSSRRHTILRCSSDQAAVGQFDSNNQPSQEESSTKDIGFLGKWMVHSAEMRAKVAKLGLAAVLAYGLFDGVTYTTFFVLAFLGYEKSTGKNPAANLQALLGIVLLMWTGNNVTRPFRVAGAAALAPAINKVLKSIQEKLNLPSIVYAFALVAGIFGSACLSVAGLLILSRWGK